jgi:hypothetical protein
MPARAALEKVTVIIYTARQRIDGTYHLPLGGRLSDHLNGRHRQQEFIPLTDAKVANLPDEDRIVLESDFVAVNMQSIMLLSPKPKPSSG